MYWRCCCFCFLFLKVICQTVWHVRTGRQAACYEHLNFNMQDYVCVYHRQQNNEASFVSEHSELWVLFLILPLHTLPSHSAYPVTTYQQSLLFFFLRLFLCVHCLCSSWIPHMLYCTVLCVKENRCTVVTLILSWQLWRYYPFKEWRTAQIIRLTLSGYEDGVMMTSSLSRLTTMT